VLVEELADVSDNDESIKIEEREEIEI